MIFFCMFLFTSLYINYISLYIRYQLYLTNIDQFDVNFSEEGFLSLAYIIFSMLFNLAEHVRSTVQVIL